MKNLTALCALSAALLMAGCVSQQKYDESQQKNAELEAQYQQLNSQMGSEVASRDMQIQRHQNAIKVSVKSQLLFPSGGYEMSAEGKAQNRRVELTIANAGK